METFISADNSSPELFHLAGREIYKVLYQDETMDDNFMAILEKYMNLISFLGDDFYDFKNLMYFALELNRVDIETYWCEIYQKLAYGILATNMSDWMERIDLSEMTREEAIYMWRAQS